MSKYLFRNVSDVFPTVHANTVVSSIAPMHSCTSSWKQGVLSKFYTIIFSIHRKTSLMESKIACTIHRYLKLRKFFFVI